MAGKTSKGMSSTLITIIAIVVIIALIMLFSYFSWTFFQTGEFGIIGKITDEGFKLENSSTPTPVAMVKLEAFGNATLTIGEEEYQCTCTPEEYGIFANSGKFVLKYNPNMTSAGTFTIGKATYEYTEEMAAAGESVVLAKLVRREYDSYDGVCLAVIKK